MFKLEKAMPKSTQVVFETLSNIELISRWTLVGGTALSMYLYHRYSEDLDFFINTKNLSSYNNDDIEIILEQLAEQGHQIKAITSDSSHANYDISGVKVSFNASRQKINLKKDIQSVNHIKIASLKVISAMKIYTILKHRIKSRDFYDILELIKQGNTLQELIINMQKQYDSLPLKYSENYIEERLLKRDVDSGDEGLEGLTFEKAPTFQKLRNFFEEIIVSIYKTDIEAIEKADKCLRSKIDIPKELLNKKYGITGMNLLEYSLSCGAYNVYEKILSLGIYDPSIPSGMCDSAILLLANSKKYDFLDRSLYYSASIIQELSNLIKINKDTQLHSIVETHKVLNRCLKFSDDIEKVNNIFLQSSLSIKKDEFDERLKTKKLTKVKQTQSDLK